MKNPQYKIHKFTDEKQKPELSIRMQLKTKLRFTKIRGHKNAQQWCFRLKFKRKKKIFDKK